MQMSAFPEEGIWLKGNYHTHTTLSDGVEEPMAQIRLYKEQGYDWLAFTDHNVMNARPQWNKELLMLPAWERDISFVDKVKCIHVIGLFSASTPIEAIMRRPKGDKEKMTMQDLLDEMRNEDKNVFLSIAHPCWSRMEPEELAQLEGFDAIEVFNTGTERLCHEGHAEYLWDYLLRRGRKVDAVACDDTHGHTACDDHFGGWVMVKAKEKSRAAVLDALKHGAFYASSGPVIHDWGRTEQGEIYVSCSPCEEIHFITYPARGKAVYGNLTKAVYPLKGGETYVRIECIDKAGRRAWTNPIWL